jgi:protein transport protein SEC31
MPLKYIHRTATVAWSPGNPSDPLLATGTVAGALDDSFSNTTELEIFRLNLNDKNTCELTQPAGVISSNARYVSFGVRWRNRRVY